VLAAGEPEPEPDAPAVEAEIERNVRSSAAMTNEILEAPRRRARAAVKREVGGGSRAANRRQGGRLQDWIVALGQARAELIEEVQLGAWLDLFPATGSQPLTAHVASRKQIDPLTGRPEPAVQPQRTFGSVLDDLLHDSEQLPTMGAVQPTQEFLRWQQKQNVMLERVDADGVAHQTPFRSLPPEKRARPLALKGR
jgi:hypothetical protein